MKVLAFGIVKDIVDGPALEVSLKDEATVDDLKRLLEEKYPRLKQLASYMVAVNDEYASGENEIKTGDEIAIIPPVSGG